MTAPNRAYLSLGSNIDPEKNLPAAVNRLARYGQVVSASTVWETRPLGGQGQPNYLNAVVLLETSLSAKELKYVALTSIENDLGRVRSTDQNAPRPIDIDILLFNHDILSIGDRRIPNPEIYTRAFVAIPLAEIAPDLIEPQFGKSIQTISRMFNIETVGMRIRPDVSLESCPDQPDADPSTTDVR